jgi:methyl coenzyme M reductase beta subunit
MKKQIIVALVCLFMGFTAMAQDNMDNRIENNVNAYIEKVESNIKLTDEEKTKIFELKKVHTISFWEVSEKFKGKPELSDEKTKVSKAFSESLIKEFGRERGLEILKASRVKKDDK